MERRAYAILGELVDRRQFETGAPEEQLALPFYGKSVNVDGTHDPKCAQITYWGKAVHLFDNIYRCYASVWGTVAIVEVTITRLP